MKRIIGSSIDAAAEAANGSSPPPVCREEFLATMPEHFHSVARQYGEELFGYCINGSMVQQAITTMLRRLRGNQEMMHAINVIAGAYNNTAMQAAVGNKWTQEMIAQVNRDITVAHSLATAGGAAAGSAIILPH